MLSPACDADAATIDAISFPAAAGSLPIRTFSSTVRNCTVPGERPENERWYPRVAGIRPFVV